MSRKPNRRQASRRRRPSEGIRLELESLEPRTLLAGDLAAAAVSITWQGDQALALPGRWIVSGRPAAASAPDARLASAAALDAALSDSRVHALAVDSLLADGLVIGPTGSLSKELAVSRELRDGTYLVVGDARLDAGDVATIFSTLSMDVRVEPDFLLHVDGGNPTDPLYSSLWGMNNTGQTGGTVDADIDALEAWDRTNFNFNGEEVVVAVIDTGVDYTHTDLAANMWVNEGEIPGNDIDDDGNGFVDDVYGYNFVGDGIGDGDPLDDYWHGTHVAGTIAARGYNGLGVIGVAPANVRIMALKILDASGDGTTADAIEALDYVTKMKRDFGVNVRVTNNSWGGSPNSDELADAIADAGAEGIFFIASAGNSGQNSDVTPHYPSGFALNNIISVAATRHNDVLPSFSNYGQTSVDLAAPGEGILSTTPNNAYGMASGTSMASPHVAGALALLLSQSPSLSVSQARSLLLGSVDVLPSLSGKVASGGRLNVDKLLDAAGVFDAAPHITLAGQTLSYIENQVATSVDAALTLTDVNSSTVTGAAVAIASNYANGQDVLSFTNQLGISGSFDSANGTLTLTGSASVANYQTALRAVKYFNSSESPSTSTRTITFTVTDADGLGIASRLLSVTSVNDPPQLAPLSNQTMTNSDVISVPLSATDLDTPASSLVYSATVEDYAVILKQQNGYGAESTSAYNWGGQQEKWVQSGTTWYFILPSGALYRWGGGTQSQLVGNSTLLAQLQPIYYSTITRLTAPTSIAASAPVNNSVSPALLTVDPNDNFVGTLRYQASVSDGAASHSQTFLVTVNAAVATGQPPVLTAIPNQTMANSDVLSLNLSVTDPDTPIGNLVFTAGLEDYGYVLKQQYNFAAETTTSYNWGGKQEKWLKSGTQWYFILPSGALYRWGGGTPAQMISGSTLVAQLQPVYYTTTTRLSSPTSIATSAPVSGTAPPVLTVDPNNSYVGTLRCQVSVSDGSNSDSKSFLVTVNTGGPVNQPPQLAPISNQTMTNSQVLNINLAASDPDTPAANLVYSAAVDDYGFVLKQQLGLGAESTGAYNWGGQQEKWITAGTSWYFILPSGALYSWGGGAPGQMITNSTLVAQLHAVYYTTLTRLTAPTSIAASAPVSGTSPAVLTIDPNDNFVGTLRYQATVSDGTSSDSKSFLVTVNTGGPVNQPPQLAAIANQTMTNAQVLNINLSATDPDTPLANLVYTAGLDDYGYVLKQQYGLTSESTGTYNWGGQQEKWFKSGTTWYFILPSGAFYRWGGGTPAQLLSTGTLLAQLHTVYYTTTSRLTAATSIAASAPVSGTAPAVLTVDPNDSFVGTLRYAVTVSDGNSSDTKNFLVTVNQA